MKYENNVTIKQWAEDDQPREKMLMKGKTVLSDAELIAILLRSGTRNLTALGLAQVVLQRVSHDLDQLARLSPGEISKIPGVGTAKATSIIAAMELGRRRREQRPKKGRSIRSSKDAFEVMSDVFYDLPHEEFWLLILTRSNDVISRRKISQGGVSGTVADNKLIFKYTLEELGSSIVILHNHPSGNLTPSKADEDLTMKIKMASQNLDIMLLDHLIVNNDRFFSFADEGLL